MTMDARVEALLKDPAIIPLLHAIADRRRDAAIGELNWLFNVLTRQDAKEAVKGESRD
jgi:hypothetical protein